ncbi:MAG: PASTA domain-containing protein [Deltaproteobacteria bacterium]|nr:PASTA domain-containing protein [Deltaproteobacteria bacterium]
MIKKINFTLIIFIVVFSCIIAPGRTQAASSTWTIEIISARGLRNKDWGPEGKSDPYIKVYAYTGKEELIGKTPVKNNTLSPVWHYIIKKTYPAGQEMATFAFVIWDKDRLKDKFLGVARLTATNPGVEYHLNLHRRMRLVWPTVPGRFAMPGTLRVKITRTAPLVKVPDLNRKTEKQAREILTAAGLKPGCTGGIIVGHKSDVGKIFDQRPSPGEDLALGRMVYFHVGMLPTYAVPNVIGRNIRMAKWLLRPFKRIAITYKAPLVGTPRDKWLRVADQTPKPDQGRKTGDTLIQLIVIRPPKDYKLIVPDVVGDAVDEARKALQQANMPRIKWVKERTSDEKKNNTIVAQNPAPGKKISWDVNTPVDITVGWYANGKSLYAAKPTLVDKPFTVKFDKPDSATYRLVEITKPGYLTLKATGQGNRAITPMASYYQQGNGWTQVNDGRYQLPAAQRVTKGEWVVQVEPEIGESHSDTPCQFELNFIEEFDPAEPNNTIDQAVEILPDAQMVVGFIGENDSDYYRFEIKKAGYLEVLFKELTSQIVDNTSERGLDILYALYTHEKKKIASYYPPATTFLTPGQYYIQIKGKGGWNRLHYQFDLRFHEARDVGEPNNSPETAFEIQPGKSIPVAYSTEDEDYYLIKSNQPGYVVLNHDRKIPFDIDFNHYGSDGKAQGHMVYLPAAIRISGEKLVSLSAKNEGRYIVDPPANLQVGFIPAEQDAFEPNDTPEKAAPIKLNQTITALLLPRFDQDNYRFTIKNPGEIFFDMVKPEGEKIPIKGKILSSDGKTEIVEELFLPCTVKFKAAGDYILQFGQEPGFERLCQSQYQLTLRDGKKDSLDNERNPRTRYGDNKNTDCIALAKEAYQFLLSGEYEKAKNLYAKALHCLPDNEVIWNDYGVSCYKLKDNKTARTALKKAIELNKNYALPYRNLAVIAWQGNDDDQGRKMAVKASSLNPIDENLRYAAHAYIVLAEKQKGEEKRKLLKKAAEYYKEMKNIPKASRGNLDKIEALLKGNSSL